MKIVPPTRKPDRHGDGGYLAPRGSRQHHGVDKACYPGSIALAVSAGTVTKLGYPYASGIGGAMGDSPFQYVQVTDNEGYEVRYFYVEPSVNVGAEVTVGSELGVTQNLDRRYPGITEHIHFEVKKDGNYVDPTNYLMRHCMG